MDNDLYNEVAYNLSKSFFGRFPEKEWNHMINDINSDINFDESNIKITRLLKQLKSIFCGSINYIVEISKNVTQHKNNIHSSFNINIYVKKTKSYKMKIIEIEYFPNRTDGLSSDFDIYSFWIDINGDINKNILIKNIYFLDKDNIISFSNNIFFNSSYIIDKEDNIIVNINTRFKLNGKVKSIRSLPYKFDDLCRDLVNDPKKIAHALYFKNNEVTYEDFIKDEKSSLSLLSMIDI